MPLPRRVIYDPPIYSQSNSKDSSDNHLNAKNPHFVSLLSCLKQIGALSQYAAEIFDGVASMTKETNERMNDASQRMKALVCVVDEVEKRRITHEAVQDLAKQQGILSLDRLCPIETRNGTTFIGHVKPTVTVIVDKHIDVPSIVTRQTLPPSIESQYNLCEPSPQFRLISNAKDKLDIAYKRYSDPSLLLKSWIDEEMVQHKNFLKLKSQLRILEAENDNASIDKYQEKGMNPVQVSKSLMKSLNKMQKDRQAKHTFLVKESTNSDDDDDDDDENDGSSGNHTKKTKKKKKSKLSKSKSEKSRRDKSTLLLSNKSGREKVSRSVSSRKRDQDLEDTIADSTIATEDDDDPPPSSDESYDRVDDSSEDDNDDDDDDDIKLSSRGRMRSFATVSELSEGPDEPPPSSEDEDEDEDEDTQGGSTFGKNTEASVVSGVSRESDLLDSPPPSDSDTTYTATDTATRTGSEYTATEGDTNVSSSTGGERLAAKAHQLRQRMKQMSGAQYDINSQSDALSTKSHDTRGKSSVLELLGFRKKSSKKGLKYIDDDDDDDDDGEYLDEQKFRQQASHMTKIRRTSMLIAKHQAVGGHRDENADQLEEQMRRMLGEGRGTRGSVMVQSKLNIQSRFNQSIRSNSSDSQSESQSEGDSPSQSSSPSQPTNISKSKSKKRESDELSTTDLQTKDSKNSKNSKNSGGSIASKSKNSSVESSLDDDRRRSNLRRKDLMIKSKLERPRVALLPGRDGRGRRRSIMVTNTTSNTNGIGIGIGGGRKSDGTTEKDDLLPELKSEAPFTANNNEDDDDDDAPPDLDDDSDDSSGPPPDDDATNDGGGQTSSSVGDLTFSGALAKWGSGKGGPDRTSGGIGNDYGSVSSTANLSMISALSRMKEVYNENITNSIHRSSDVQLIGANPMQNIVVTKILDLRRAAKL